MNRIFFFLILATATALGHGGGLDARGGHHNRSAGGYHFHRSVGDMKAGLRSRIGPPRTPFMEREWVRKTTAIFLFVLFVAVAWAPLIYTGLGFEERRDKRLSERQERP